MDSANSNPSDPQILPLGEEAMARAVKALADGEPVGVPTETVYGLAARADSDSAVAAIYEAKGRPSFNPLIVHVSDMEHAKRLAHMDARGERLARLFWPGPLTMVLPRREGAALADAVTAGLPTVAIRCPAHPAMQALLARSPFALAAPSANRSGGVSPSSAAHVAQSLKGRLGLVIDGGETEKGIESTIVALDAEGWRLLRPGPVTQEMLSDALGSPPAPTREGIEAPGQMTSHYAPGKPVRLNADAPADDEFMIGFGGVPGDITLSASGDLFEAAARLYACLHIAAEAKQPRIAVAPIPQTGVGVAINDRLARAAA